MTKKLAISAPTPISPMKKKKKKSTMTPGSLAARASIWAKPPVVTLAILYIAQYSRMERASMIDILGTDYIRTARAKGLRERTVVYKHALKNALIPVVTLAGMQFSQVFAGAVLVETVFNWPGMGRLAYESILRKDYPTLLGILFCSVFVVIIANVLTDFAYRFLDPKMRVGRR